MIQTIDGETNLPVSFTMSPTHIHSRNRGKLEEKIGSELVREGFFKVIIVLIF